MTILSGLLDTAVVLLSIVFGVFKQRAVKKTGVTRLQYNAHGKSIMVSDLKLKDVNYLAPLVEKASFSSSILSTLAECKVIAYV